MPDIGSKLFPNVTTMIVQLCSTGVMLILFKKFLWKPILAYFAKRADYIEKNISDATDMRAQASTYLEESEKQSREAAKQYREIVNQAKDDATTAKQQIIDEANKQARDKIEQARHEIEAEKLQAKQEMKEEIVDIAVAVATKVMNKDMDTSTNDALIKDFVDHVVN